LRDLSFVPDRNHSVPPVGGRIVGRVEPGAASDSLAFDARDAPNSLRDMQTLEPYSRSFLHHRKHPPVGRLPAAVSYPYFLADVAASAAFSMIAATASGFDT